MATHSSTLAWKIPWMEEPGRLQFMGSLSQTWLSDFTFPFHFPALEKEMATHSSVLAWRIPGMVEPGGLPSVGSHRVGHYWSDLAGAEPKWLHLNELNVLKMWLSCTHGSYYVLTSGLFPTEPVLDLRTHLNSEFNSGSCNQSMGIGILELY